MAGLSTTEKLTLIDDIVHLSEAIERNGQDDPHYAESLHNLTLLLTNLNNAQPHEKISKFIESFNSQHTPSDIHKQLKGFLDTFAGMQNQEKRSLDELKERYTQSQKKVESTIDSHNLQQILENQRIAVDQITQLNQINEAVRNGVREALLTDPAFAQVGDWFSLPGTQAELDSIINALSLDPHKDISGYSKAIADRLRSSNDRRIRTLIRHADLLENQDTSQQLIRQKIEQSPEAVKAFELIQGKDTNKIRESLEAAVIRDNTNNGQLAVKEQLRSILKDAGITDESLLDNIEGHLLAHTSISTQDAQVILTNQLGNTFKNLSSDTQIRLINSFVVNFTAAGLNKEIVALRADIVAEGLTAEQLNQNLLKNSDGVLNTSHLFADAYRLSPSSTSTEESPLDLLEIDRIASSTKEVINPANQDFLNTRVSTAESVKLWGAHYRDPFTSTLTPSSPNQPLSPAQNFWLQTQAKTQVFREGAKAFWQPIGKGLSRLSLSPIGGGIRTMSFGVKQLFRNAPPIWQQLSTFNTSAQSVFHQVIARGDIAPQKWVVYALGGIILTVTIIIPIIFVGPFSVARTNLTPVDTGTSSGPEDPNYTALICTPDDPECPESFCKNCERPVKCGPVSQCPGGTGTHRNANAIDFGMKGCPPTLMGVYSQVSGQVTAVSMNYPDGSGYSGSSAGYGNYIDVTYTDPKTGRQFILRSAHLSNQKTNGFTPKIAEGQTISPTQIIGYADHTGNSTAAHLHYEIRAVDGGKGPSITSLIPGSGCN